MLLVALAVAFWVRAAAQGPVPAELRGAIEQIDAMAAAELARDGLGSVTVGAVSGGSLVWTKSHGYADMERKRPASRDSVYRIGSVTKEFTGVMLLQLVEQQRVHLSDPVEKYVPEINRLGGRFVHASPITLLQLATMTSGIAREPQDLGMFLKGPVAQWERTMLAALSRTRYAYEPGTRYQYSNIGYAILGAALSHAAGQSYVEYVEQHILAPLGMTQTAFEPNPQIRRHLTKGYAIANGKVDTGQPEREHRGRGYKVPNGAMYSTIGDLARFVAFQLGDGSPGVLKKETLEDCFARVYSAGGALATGYGIGVQVTRRGELVAYGHGGSVAGYQAAAYIDRVTRTGIVVLRNVSGGVFNVPGLCLRSLEKLAAARGPAR